MGYYKTLLHTLMLFYQSSFLVVSIGMLFLDDEPIWFNVALMVLSWINLIAIHVFIKGMGVLDDNDAIRW